MGLVLCLGYCFGFAPVTGKLMHVPYDHLLTDFTLFKWTSKIKAGGCWLNVTS
jgi:hypothetical protein